ncbi:Ig-like domain-containing protein [Zwartia sp.]|uniref:Ig-like domain-containing protein n=1 Tax=Zwartia sp. TaxID=2978004 RepID=UPI0027171E7B|nr:Ig-like domain-containing protein [Zwartia sp.]MDO9025095.1 Ig-like domain-containing protein [Zwartia sp.]
MAATTGNINISVTSAKQTFLTTKSASLYTVAFDGTTPYWSTIYTAGSISSPTATIPLINSGKLYIIESNASLADLQTKITKQSDIDVSNSTVAPNQFRYDSFEYALSPADQGGTPQGNLTSVNGFGFPMALEVAYSDSTTATVGYAVKADTLTTELSSAGAPLINFNSGDLNGEFQYAGSPSTNSGGGYTKPAAFTETHWTTYLNQLGTQLGSEPIRITGIFNGAPDAAQQWHNQAFYNYKVSYDNATSTFILTPEENSQVKGTIKLTSAVLAKNIYAIDASTSADIYQVVDGVETLYTSQFLGANDQWGAVFTQFLTGLDLGYLGQEGVSPNPSISNPVDLNGNWNWSPIYAFGDNLVSGGPVTPTFDSYSKVFFDNSNSYGSQYSDNAMSQYSSGGPLVNLFETVGGVNQTVNTNQITIKIFDDGETPTGYTQPTLYNYIASGSGYATFATLADADIANFVINLGIPAGSPSSGDQNTGKNRLAETSWFANPEKFALSYQYQTSANNWSNASFVYADAGNPDNLWSQWSLTPNGEKASITPGTTPGAQGIGSVLLNNIPIGKDAGDITWHKISVYDTSLTGWQSAPLKTFNLYTTSDGTGKFLYTAGQLAIDGGATVSTGQGQTAGVSTTVNLLVGSGTFIDPVLLAPEAKQGASYATSGTAPSAPVVGYFNASDTFVAQAGQTEMISPNATGKANNVVFGWTGYNPNATSDTNNLWTKYYTNKVSAQNIVEVTWSLASTKDHGTGGSTLTTADIDGKWITEQLRLTPGQYQVTMTEYTEQNGSRIQFAQQSSPLTLTLDGSQDTILAMRDAYLVSQGAKVVDAAQGTLVNDTGAPTVATLLSGPANGTLQFNSDGSFTYTPDQDFVGLDSFVYWAEKDVGGGVIEKSQAAVNLQVVPDIGTLANSLENYSTVGLTLFGYLEHGATQSLSNTYLAELQTYQNQGLSEQEAMYKLANSIGETSAAEGLFPFLANPTTDIGAINSFLDKVYDVMFDRAPDDVGRAYWINDIQSAINRGDDIDPYIFIIMNGAQTSDMQHLTAKSMIANEQIFQQYQHNDSINDVNSALFLTGASQLNLLDSMVTVYNDAIA